MAVINIRGVLVDLILEIDPELYGPFVTTDNKGKILIIVQCMNSIYRMIVLSLLYCKKSVNTLKNTGFQLNPFFSYVTNSMVNDKQKTI